MERMLLALLFSFAVYRISRMVTREDGPYAMFETLRLSLGKKAALNKTWKTLADLSNCPYCLGVWFSAIFAIKFVELGIIQYFTYALGIAGLQAFLQALEDKEP